MKTRPVSIIVTVGPATNSEEHLIQMKHRGVAFVRLNMSHSSIEDLRRSIALAQKVGIPYIIDTEGSQVRTGMLASAPVHFEENDEVQIAAEPAPGDRRRIYLTPGMIVDQLEPGDVLYLDFDSLILRVTDVSRREVERHVLAQVVSRGSLGNNKGVHIDPASGRPGALPTLTPKDLQSIAVGLEAGVGHVAASFMRSGEAVDEVRRATMGRMKIISKIECIDGLRNLDAIIEKSDSLLIDRGDLSKEISLMRVPFTQKIIVQRARRQGKPVVVATNFLESMTHNRRPTRAEVHDIESSITDGAAGLTLAAETAIGRHPIECINVMNAVIDHVHSAVEVELFADKEAGLVASLEKEGYLLDLQRHSPLVPPHGGRLVNRLLETDRPLAELAGLPALRLDEEQEMDVEQIAVGAFSPLEGFMGRTELESVVENGRLPSGIAWPLPVCLECEAAVARRLRPGQDVVLRDHRDSPLAILHFEEAFAYDARKQAGPLFGTLDPTHPGVAKMLAGPGWYLAGRVDLLRRRRSETAEYEQTPAQTRRLFEHVGWSTIVGFHTRNVIHRAHEFIQRQALALVGADGLFVHPVVGRKKRGDFHARYIIASYEAMLGGHYPPGRMLFATFPSYSRYAGPREALFTAICRQNYGCSHFIVGRDHTGVGRFYSPTASQEIFDRFPELGIKPVRFNGAYYSARLERHCLDDGLTPEADKLHISGTEAREIFRRGTVPPDWYMRPEVSQIIREALSRGEEVFVP